MHTTRTLVLLSLWVLVASGPAHAATTATMTPTPADRSKADTNAVCGPERTNLPTGGKAEAAFTWGRLVTLTSSMLSGPAPLDPSWVERRTDSTPALSAFGMQPPASTKSDHVGVAMLALIGSSLVTLGVLVRKRLFNSENENEPV